MEKAVAAGVAEARDLVVALGTSLAGPAPRLARGAGEVPTGWNGLQDCVVLAVYSLAMLVFWRVAQAVVFPPVAAALGIRSAKKRAKHAVALREFLFYCVSLYCHFSVFGREKWIYELDELWMNGPEKSLPAQGKAMYFLEASWYVSGFLSLVIDPKKKDFVEMSIHHIITTLLLTLSWNSGYTRVGILVVLLHNASDPPLQLAKMLNYTGTEPACTITFVVYLLTFLVTRLIFYPPVIYSANFRAPGCLGRELFGHEKLLVYLLTALLPIHAYWFSLIIKVAIGALSKGKAEKDERSDDDDDDDEDDAAPAKPKDQ